MASPIKLAVLRTTAYASVFNYHLSFEELYQYLICPKPVSKTKLRPYFIAKPQPLKLFNQLKWRRAKQTAKLLSFIPWIKMVAATGALAMNNCCKNDDIDLMIITAANRLWLTRLLSLLLLFPFLRRGSRINNRLCLNLWLDESALVLNQQNLYTAHELCQLKPLYNRDQTYQKFISANLWYKNFLPNWRSTLQGPTLKARTLPNRNSRLPAEKGPPAGGGCVLNGINFLSFRLQYFYMKPKMTLERVSPHFAFFHPRPTGEIVLKKYYARTRTILVTGVFDILHREHKKLLSAAKKLGGILLVGLETDFRVRQLKGPLRPINPLRLRLKNLQQLGIADKVFALPKQFNDLNHFTSLINQIRPDILAVSSSTPHLAVKRQILKRFNGRVVIVLRHNPKISTSKLLKSSL